MRRVWLASLFAALTASGATSTWAAEPAHVAPVRAYIDSHVRPWLGTPLIINAIKQQNAAHAGITDKDIAELDTRWQAAFNSAADQRLVDSVMDNPLSQFLRARQESSRGAIAEIFVMDSHGLNVGQSEITTDYWQGDEPKFRNSFGRGRDAIFIDEIGKDESAQALVSQVSLTLSDETGSPIGAITIGVVLDNL